MRTRKIVGWLLAAALLAGCSGAARPPAAASNGPTATARATTPITAAPSTGLSLELSPSEGTPPNAAAADQPGINATRDDGAAAGDEPVLTSQSPADAKPESAGTYSPSATPSASPAPTETLAAATETPVPVPWSVDPDPLQIEVMRQQTYPGSAITVEQTLDRGSDYSRAIVSYQSDDYKIYALMTVPDGTKPSTGWPVVVFNHGYIAPTEYRSTERYKAYVDYIARRGYIVFMSDYRGWADSEGGETVAGGGYGNPALTVDVLNAVASLKSYADADPHRIGMWGHSMGGQLTLRAMVVSEDIKAGVIWGGVVAPYPDVIARWGRLRRNLPTTPSRPANSDIAWIQSFGAWVEDFGGKYGSPEENSDFWSSISPNTYLADLSGPIQLHHSTTDAMVPLAWSETLDRELTAASKQPHEFYTYPGDNHNISANFQVAMQRTVAFFDRYVRDQPSASPSAAAVPTRSQPTVAPPTAPPTPSPTPRPATGGAPMSISQAASRETQIRVTIGGTVLTGHLWDNATARDLIAQLPLTLTFRDYNRQEKLAPLPRNLSMDGVPPGDAPHAGDIVYYAPPGVLVFSYKDIGYFTGIVRLGRFDDGVDAILSQTSDFAVRIELAE